MQNNTKSFTVSEAAGLLQFCETFSAGTRVYFDRYLTNNNLIESLLRERARTTVIIMKNRIRNGNNFLSDKILQENGKGSTDSLN